MKNDKLLPCPFCGFEPRYIKRGRGFTRHGVGCSNMSCIIWLPKNVKKDYLYNYVSTYACYNIMVKAWNTRSGNANNK